MHFCYKMQAILHSNSGAVTISRTCLLLTRLAIKVHCVLLGTNLQLAFLLQFWDTRTTPTDTFTMAKKHFHALSSFPALNIVDYGCFTNPPPSFSTVLANRDRTLRLFCVYARCSRTS